MQGYLRKVNEQDKELLFQWANERAVRQNSFSTAEIKWEDHEAWFARTLARADVCQYIYMCEEEPIGQVRIAIEGQTAEISYSICEKMRGQGHGKHMLEQLVQKVKKDYPQVSLFVAKVKPENAVSQKVFMDMGYQEKYRAYEFKLKSGNGK